MTASPVYPCDICGRKLPAEKLIYSTFTGRRYCGDLKRHHRIIARAKRLGARQAVTV